MVRLTLNNIRKQLIGRTLMVSDNLTHEMRKVVIRTINPVDTWYSINSNSGGDDEAALELEQIRSLLYVGYTLDQIHTFHLDLNEGKLFKY